MAVKQGEGYNPAHTIDDSGALSWLMYNSSQMGGGIDNQVVQAAVWHLTGNTIASAGGDLNQVWSVIAQAQACNNGISAANTAKSRAESYSSGGGGFSSGGGGGGSFGGGGGGGGFR